MKKILTVLTAMFMLISCFSLAGCYTVESGTKKDIAGTYQLVENEYDNIDIFKSKNMVEYLVIGENNRGYRYYMDNTMENYSCQEIGIEFLPSPEDETLFDSINYTLYKRNYYHVDDNDQIQLGFHKGDKALKGGTVEIHTDLINTKQSKIRYKKISDDVTINTVAKKVNKELKPLPYELAEFAHPFQGQIHYTEKESGTCHNTEYLYDIFMFDLLNNKMDRYFCIKGGEPQVEKGIEVSYENGSEITLLIDGITYKKVDCGFIERDIICSIGEGDAKEDKECTYTFSASFKMNLTELLTYYESMRN